MTENSYASPESPADWPTQSRVQSLKWLRGAALGMIAMASLELIGSGIALILFPIQIAFALVLNYATEFPPAFIALQFLLALAIFLRGIVMVIGAWHMRNGENYRKARVGAIVSALGIHFPLTWYSTPFGIWAFILLRREKYKKLFNS